MTAAQSTSSPISQDTSHAVQSFADKLESIARTDQILGRVTRSRTAQNTQTHAEVIAEFDELHLQPVRSPSPEFCPRPIARTPLEDKLGGAQKSLVRARKLGAPRLKTLQNFSSDGAVLDRLRVLSPKVLKAISMYEVLDFYKILERSRDNVQSTRQGLQRDRLETAVQVQAYGYYAQGEFENPSRIASII